MKYSKQPLDYSEILDLLVSRGLIIADRNKAIECLKVVSYFRLDNYFHPMESDKIRHIFKSGSTFENAMDLYGSYNIVVFLTICISYANNCFTL